LASKLLGWRYQLNQPLFDLSAPRILAILPRRTARNPKCHSRWSSSVLRYCKMKDEATRLSWWLGQGCRGLQSLPSRSFSVSRALVVPCNSTVLHCKRLPRTRTNQWNFDANTNALEMFAACAFLDSMPFKCRFIAL
jgi:hypothetical protein